MNIAFLNCHGDDVYCFRRELIDALVADGHKIILSCPDSSRLDYFRTSPSIIIKDIYIDRRGTNPFHDIRLLYDYIRLFKNERPDIVCSFTIKPNIYGSIAADILGIPHINNITGLGSAFQNGGPIKRVVKLLYKVALHKSKKVFFQNKYNMQIALKSNLIPDNVLYECIPGSGVNLSHFRYSEKNNEYPIVFNYIGRVLKDKRIDDYLSAAKYIKSTYTDVVFNIIGFIEPSEIHYAQELAHLESEGVIHYYGAVDDVRPYISACDAIIHPSSYGEGISNVLLETAASGRSIITTDVPGCKDCVDNEVNGYIYEAENIPALVRCIKKFISLSKEDRRNMGRAGRIKVENEFDRTKVVQAYLRELAE